MNLDDFDWQVMRSSVVIFFISLVFSCLSVIAGRYYNSTALLVFNNEKKLLQKYSSKYLEAEEEEGLIRDYYQDFIGFQESGLVGQERRLDWIEALHTSAEGIKVPSFRYVINPQEKYVPDFAVDTAGFQIYTSNMKLSIDMLHEEDLQRVLDDLNAIAPGIFNVSGCKLTRLTRNMQQNVKQANIAAECKLNWFTIRTSDGSEISLL